MPDSMTEAFPPAASPEPIDDALANPWAQGAAH
jgi:hypothetical protein